MSGQEPLKITIVAKDYGYSGKELAQCLRKQNIECEFADPDNLVLMVTPEIKSSDIDRLKDVLISIPPRNPVLNGPPEFRAGEKRLSLRESMLSPGEILPVTECAGRVLASASIGCPPAVPILICGEVIDDHAIRCFQYYGIDFVTVIYER